MAGTIPGAGITTPLTLTTADNTTQITLTSTDPDANSGPALDYYRNSSSPADADYIGTTRYIGRNDNSQDVNFALISAQANDVSDGTEDGTYIINTMRNGALDQTFNITPTEVIINEDSKDVDFRVESNGSTNMLFVDGGNNEVVIQKASSGATATAGSVLIVEDDDNTELSILGGSSSVLAINFGHSGDADDAIISYNTTSGSETMIFTVNAAAAMRIESTGQVGVLRSGGGQFFDTSHKIVGELPSDSYAFLATQNMTAGGGPHYFAKLFTNGQSLVGSITTSNTGTAFNTSSDYRLKENVETDWNATTRLKQLKPSRFNFIADADTTLDGFLAHEVSSIVPEAITGDKDATETKTKVVVNSSGSVIHQDVEEADWTAGKVADEDGNTQYPTDSTWEASKVVPVYQGIDQSKLVPLMVKTIQELEARIKTLEDA